METTDKTLLELEDLVRKLYPQYDNPYAFRTKKGRYIFGYTNDYPLQHGDGVKNDIDETMARFLIRSKFIL